MECRRRDDQKSIHEKALEILPDVNVVRRGVEEWPIVDDDEDDVTYPAKEAEKFHHVHLSHAFDRFEVSVLVNVFHLEDFEIQPDKHGGRN